MHRQQQQYHYGPAYAPQNNTAGYVSTKYYELLYYLDLELQYFPFFVNMAHSYNMRVGEFVLYAFGAFSLLIVMMFGQNSLAHFVAFPYPFIQTLAALESPRTTDDTQWLTYWCVYGLFTVIESFTDFFVGWIPFYFLVKLVFLVFCFLPSTRGAEKIYRYGIRPWMYKHTSAGQAAGRYYQQHAYMDGPHM